MQSHVCELLQGVAWHLGQQGAFAVNHLVVRERKHEALAVRVAHAECQPFVMVSSVDRILAHIGERVVHPTHVPFVAEPKPALLRGPGDHGPGGRFLGHGAGAVRSHFVVQYAQELDRFQVLGAAVPVRDPVTLLA